MLLSSSRRLAQRCLSTSPAVRAGASAAAAAADAAPLRYSSLVLERGSGRPVPADLTKNLVFGAVKSEHMLEVDWSAARGWQAPRIFPVAPLSLDPAASCLHYGLQAFEGMKAYLDADGKARLFRPELNMVRARGGVAARAARKCDCSSARCAWLCLPCPSCIVFRLAHLFLCPQIRLAKSMRTLAMPALCVGVAADAPPIRARARHRRPHVPATLYSLQAGGRVFGVH